jgi:hypothetical protein
MVNKTAISVNEALSATRFLGENFADVVRLDGFPASHRETRIG